ncbi:MAG: hypothetical protein IPK75_20505 [Acidobacteria bacterium]|nr:hypothetical protein [Acidobacteriota bacterium]
MQKVSRFRLAVVLFLCMAVLAAPIAEAFTIVSVTIIAPFENTVTTDLNFQTATGGALGANVGRGVPGMPGHALGGLRGAPERSKADYAY